MSSHATRGGTAEPLLDIRRRRQGARTPSRPATATRRSSCAPSSSSTSACHERGAKRSAYQLGGGAPAATQVPCSHEVGMTSTPRGDGPEPTQPSGPSYPGYQDPAYAGQS